MAKQKMQKSKCSNCGCNFYAKEGSELLTSKQCFRCWDSPRGVKPRGVPNKGKR